MQGKKNRPGPLIYEYKGYRRGNIVRTQKNISTPVKKYEKGTLFGILYFEPKEDGTKVVVGIDEEGNFIKTMPHEIRLVKEKKKE